MASSSVSGRQCRPPGYPALETSEHFGATQARRYAVTLTEAIEALRDGPRIAGARERNEIENGLMTLHVARGGRKGRHFVLYRIASPSEPPGIDVLRLLHDSMDLARHVESSGDDNS